MKMRKAILLAAGVLVATPNIFAEKVQFDELPKSAQDAIRSRSGRVKIEDIDKSRRDGKTVYEAAFKVRGNHQEMLVGEDGTILRDVPSFRAGLAGGPVTLANTSRIGLIEAPVAVQRALQNQFVGGAQLQALHKGEWNKQTIYEASYEKNGKREKFQVTETGQPVVATLPAAPAGPKYAGLADANVQIAGGAKMNFTDAPKPVQNTINQLSNGARVEDFEKGQWNGRVVYEAAFKKDGKHMELQVLEDGSLLTKQPNAVGSAPASQSDRSNPNFKY